MDAATAAGSLERSAWQYGVAKAAQAFDRPRSGYGPLQVFLGAGTGVVAGVGVSGLPLFAQFFAGGLTALFVYWTVPTLWAFAAALRAPYEQRDDARKRAFEAEAELVPAQHQLRLACQRVAALEADVAKKAAELDELQSVRRFPDVTFDLEQQPSQQELDDGVLQVSFPVLIVNRETMLTVNLEFRLSIYSEHGDEHFSARPNEHGDMPLVILPMDHAKPVLHFDIQPSVLAVVLNREKYRVIPNFFFRLRVYERVTEQYLSLRLPSYYPPLAERGR